MTIHLSILLRPAVACGPGEVGCLSPAVWRHFLRAPDGTWWFAQLLSDCNAAVPDRAVLADHRAAHPDLWLPISIPTPHHP